MIYDPLPPPSVDPYGVLMQRLRALDQETDYGADEVPTGVDLLTRARAFMAAVYLTWPRNLAFPRATPCPDSDGGLYIYFQDGLRHVQLIFRPASSLPNLFYIDGRGRNAPHGTEQAVSPARTLIRLRWHIHQWEAPL
jgi:hypothetical protein